MDSPHYQLLGRKTFLIFLLQRLAPALAFLFLYFSSLTNAEMLGAQLTPVLTFVNRISLLCFFLFLGVGVFVAWIVYSCYRYALDEHALKIKRGFFYKKELSIPYRQIQNVHIERGIVDQLLGMSRVVILTGAEGESRHQENAEGILPLIDRHAAEALLEELLRRTNVQHVMQVVESPVQS